MMLRRLTTLLVAAAAWLLMGCEKKESEEHLVDIAVKVEKQQQAIE